ncbi:MAG: LptA/OstA family protein [Gammaproteobacteria bacterium]
MWKALTGVNAARAAALFFAAAACAAGAQKIDVRGDAAEYSADGKRAEFRGNVVVESGGIEIRAERLLVTVRAGGNIYRAFGAPVRASCAACAGTALHLRAREIVLRDEDGSAEMSGDVSLCAGGEKSCEDGEMRAESAVWRRAEGTAELRGAPVSGVWKPQDGGAPLRLSAGRISYSQKTGEVELRGDALVARDGEEIRGETISVNLKTRAVSAGGGAGRARGVFGAE